MPMNGPQLKKKLKIGPGTMIDPYNVKNYNRTTNELEEFLLFTVIVAGKTAIIQARLLDDFLQNYSDISSPFEKIRHMLHDNTLLDLLKKSKLGQYTKIFKSFSELACSNLDLRRCRAEDLEKIHGIGYKTSRFFIVYTRHTNEYAIIDVHILRFLSSLGYLVPKATPSTKNNYKKVEKLFLDYCKQNQLDVATFDLEVWTKMSTKTWF